MATLSNPEDSIAKTPEKNLLESLPPELQLRIFENTGYDDALRLTRLNKYFHALVKPEQWPFEDKAKFVQKAQLFPQHNLVAMRISSALETDLVYRMNGFACYHCFRVRPQAWFSARQCIKSMGKHGKADLDKVRIDFRSGTYIYDSYIQTYCADCNCPTGSKDSLNNSTWCTYCETWIMTRADRNHRYERIPATGEYTRFFKCPQCGDLTLACNDKKRRCCYCRRDICHSCGCTANQTGDWWCGLACSEAGWKFMQATIRDAWPLKLALKDKVDEKHVERDPEKKRRTDLLDYEDVEEALSWLSL
ncbi:hypothetical protein LTR17_015974 [Elasticomyces elasticus]|nr:hypothetical protein LTR17_015974 [Elasticomyces elasticus]